MSNMPTCTDLLTTVQNPSLLVSQLIQGGLPVLGRNGKILRYTGGFCVVFPFVIRGEKVALRCWHTNLSGTRERSRTISEYLQQVDLPYFLQFQYEEEGISTVQGVQPIIVMDWAEGKPIKEYLQSHLHNPQKLQALARDFYQMCADLHIHHISHGDLQHGNILVKEDGALVLVDYDSLYVPGLDSFNDEIKGLEGYQHESRWRNKYATPLADYFSELVIYTTIIALSESPCLWDDLQMADTDWMLFSKEDLATKGNASIFSRLCANETLKPLCEKLIDFMHRPTIEDLQPLESYVVPPAPLEDCISDKWKTGNGFVPSPSQLVDTDTIFKKMKHKPAKPVFDSSQIANKWK